MHTLEQATLFFIQYYHANYRTPVPIIDRPYTLLLLIIDQQQDSQLLA